MFNTRRSRYILARAPLYFKYKGANTKAYLRYSNR
jgi:hypothetical protein